MQTASKHAIRPATLDAIVNSAIQLLSDRSDASMSEIAQRAGIGRATLHRHFPTKLDLIRNVGEKCIAEMNAAVTASDDTTRNGVERLNTLLAAVIPLGDRYAFLRYLDPHDTTLTAHYRAQLEWASALVKQLKNEGSIADDIPTYWAVSQLDQLIWTAWSAVADGELTADEAKTLSVRTFLTGQANLRPKTKIESLPTT